MGSLAKPLCLQDLHKGSRLRCGQNASRGLSLLCRFQSSKQPVKIGMPQGTCRFTGAFPLLWAVAVCMKGIYSYGCAGVSMFPLQKLEDCRGAVWADEAVLFYISRKLVPLSFSLWNAALQCWPLLKMKRVEPIIRGSLSDLHDRKMRVVGFTYHVLLCCILKPPGICLILLSCLSLSIFCPLSPEAQSQAYCDPQFLLRKRELLVQKAVDISLKMLFDASRIRNQDIQKLFNCIIVSIWNSEIFGNNSATQEASTCLCQHASELQ